MGRLTKSDLNNVGIHDMKTLSNWMKKNIKYKNMIKLMSPKELFEKKYGSCHDQVLFELSALRLLGYKVSAYFIMEHDNKEINSQGGETHSYVIIYDDNDYYWFENAWTTHAGIHKVDNPKFIKEWHKNNRWGNYKKFTELEIVRFAGKVGDNLQDLVNRCFSEDDNINESTTKKKKLNLFFVSENDSYDGKILQPKIPNNYMTQNGFEDNKTKRICFSTSIGGCLIALSQNITNKTFYVYQPVGDHKIITPTEQQVPDVKITKERWICEPVKLVCIGKIKAIDENGPKDDGIPYRYGPNKEYEARLYSWGYQWLKRINENIINTSPILTLQENITFYDTITEVTKQNDKLYPVYILLIHSSSVVSKAIKAVTKTRFSHASISFDPTLTRMYSFARKYDSNPFIGTFKVEDIHSEWFTKRDIPYSLYVVPVKKYQMDAMKHRVEYFIRNKSKFKFDAAGLVKNYLGIADNPEYRYFCSRFVSDVLNTGSTKENPYIDEPSLMDPDEFRKTEFATYVCGGFLSDYNPEITKLLTNRILRKERLNQKREENIRTYHAGKVNESTILQNLNPFQTMVENYRLAVMTEDAYQEWEDYMSYVKLQYNQEGKLIFTDLQYNQFISISKNAYNTFFNTNDNIIKLDCIMKMQYIYQLSVKVLLTQDIVITDTTRKELSDFCMTIHTNIQKLVQKYQKIDPEFNLLEAFWSSKYYDNGKEIKEVYTTVNGKTAITHIYE